LLISTKCFKISNGDNLKSLYEEGQITQCTKDKGQKDRQWFTKHYTEN
jgi:hypothetical protein